MENTFTVVDNFSLEKENKVIENYQIIISNKSVYLLNSSSDYGNMAASLFSGIGDVVGLLDNAFGVVGGLASELAGKTLSKGLSKLAKNRSDAKLKKFLRNLDAFALDKKGVEKIDVCDLERIVVKKGFVINGKSYVEFINQTRSYKLISNKRSDIYKLIETLENHFKHNELAIKTIYL